MLQQVGKVHGVLRCPNDNSRLDERLFCIDNTATPGRKRGKTYVCPTCDSVFEDVPGVVDLKEAAVSCLCGVPHPNGPCLYQKGTGS